MKVPEEFDQAAHDAIMWDMKNTEVAMLAAIEMRRAALCSAVLLLLDEGEPVDMNRVHAIGHKECLGIPSTVADEAIAECDWFAVDAEGNVTLTEKGQGDED